MAAQQGKILNVPEVTKDLSNYILYPDFFDTYVHQIKWTQYVIAYICYVLSFYLDYYCTRY